VPATAAWPSSYPLPTDPTVQVRTRSDSPRAVRHSVDSVGEAALATDLSRVPRLVRARSDAAPSQDIQANVTDITGLQVTSGKPRTAPGWYT